MKKTLLLSVVASTMIMAGGDIAPVEPVVEAPVAASAWEFSGTGVVYYQTNDEVVMSGAGTGDLFDQNASAADAGIQLRATNADVFAGIGAGVEVSGLATLSLERNVVSNVMQSVHGHLSGGWISQAYLTYGMGNTSFKVGRQELPKALSPFAYSENWNVFANTFDAVLVVNTDIANTTIVGAWVKAANSNGMHADMANFSNLNEQDGAYMLTVQNKSIENLTLTGSYYNLPDAAEVLWGDAAYNAGDFGVAVQGGTLMPDAAGVDDMTAYGVKLTGAISGINLMAAYSSVEDGAMGQLGGETSVLYTNTVLDQVDGATGPGHSAVDQDKFVIAANMDALGGNIAAAYANASNSNSATADMPEFDEIDLVYSTDLTDSVNLTAAYVYADLDVAGLDAVNVVRVVGSYKF